VSRDVLALAAAQRVAAVSLFQMRAGKLVGPAGVQPPKPASLPGEILQRVPEEPTTARWSRLKSLPKVLVQTQLPRQELVEDWL